MATESFHSALAQVFASRIDLGNAQWYCIDLDVQYLNGLSKLFNITPEAYHLLMIEIGWVRSFKGRHGVSHSVQKNAINAFFRSPTIPYEVTKAKISSESKPHYFLRVGPFTDAHCYSRKSNLMGVAFPGYQSIVARLKHPKRQ